MGLDVPFFYGKAFPSRLLRAPLPLQAGSVPQRPQKNQLRPPPTINSSLCRFGRDKPSTHRQTASQLPTFLLAPTSAMQDSDHFAPSHQMFRLPFLSTVFALAAVPSASEMPSLQDGEARFCAGLKS